MIYEHGGDIYSHLEKGVKMLDFSANISPLGLPEGVREAVTAALPYSVTHVTAVPENLTDTPSPEQVMTDFRTAVKITKCP